MAKLFQLGALNEGKRLKFFFFGEKLEKILIFNFFQNFIEGSNFFLRQFKFHHVIEISVRKELSNTRKQLKVSFQAKMTRHRNLRLPLFCFQNKQKLNEVRYCPNCGSVLKKENNFNDDFFFIKLLPENTTFNTGSRPFFSIR